MYGHRIITCATLFRDYGACVIASCLKALALLGVAEDCDRMNKKKIKREEKGTNLRAACKNSQHWAYCALLADVCVLWNLFGASPCSSDRCFMMPFMHPTSELKGCLGKRQTRICVCVEVFRLNRGPALGLLRRVATRDTFVLILNSPRIVRSRLHSVYFLFCADRVYSKH